MSTTLDDKLAAARLIFLEKSPYFIAALLGLIPYETLEVPTCAVTRGMVLLYNPTYFESLTPLQVATRLWHEVQHERRESFDRLKHINPERANLCQDLAINSSGLAAKWDFGPDGQLPSAYGLPNDLSAEEYHARLPAYVGNSKGRTWGGCNGCGSMSGHSVNKALEEQIDQEMGRSEIEVELIADQVARDIVQHGQKNGYGNISSSWQEWAKARLTPPKVPWSVVLYNTIRGVSGRALAGSGIERSYECPDKRGLLDGSPILIPGEVRPELEAVVVLDTSGSMSSDTDLPIALREARSALISLGVPRVWFMDIDAGLSTKPRKVHAQELLNMPITGRGGTDFRPAFKEALKLRPRPSLLIYFTDGEGPAPSQPPPHMETIWCLIGKNRTSPAPWGRVVHATDLSPYKCPAEGSSTSSVSQTVLWCSTITLTYPSEYWQPSTACSTKLRKKKEPAAPK